MFDNYAAWKINENDFPKGRSLKEQITFLLNYAILAPSTLNTQPWKFEVTENSIFILPENSRHLKISDPKMRDFYISIGCALENIIEAAEYFSIRPIIEFFEETSNKCAKISFEELQTRKSRDFKISTIKNRFSDKGFYLSKKIPKEILESFKNTSDQSAAVTLIEEGITKKQITDLLVEADSKLFSNSQFKEEISRWIKPNFTGASFGMPGFTMGLNLIQSILGPTIVKKKKSFSEVQAKKDRALLTSSPYLGIIHVKNQSKNNWIKAGMLYENLSLRTVENSIRITPLSSIIEDEDTRLRLKRVLNLSSEPVGFFRMGYSSNKELHSPRAKINMETIKTDLQNTEEKLISSLDCKIRKDHIKLGKYDINYVVSGQGDPLLLLHGGNIGWGQWYPNIADLSNHFTVYALDLPGAGRSQTVDFSKIDLETDFVDTVEKFIETLKLSNPNVVGSSIGGWITLRLAIRNKVKLNKLVLVDCIGFTKYIRIPDRLIGIPAFAKFLTKTALKPTSGNKNIETFMRDVFYNKSAEIKQEFINYFYETMSISHNLLLISRLSSFWGIRNEFKMDKDLTKIKNDVLILWGQKDKLMPPEKAADSFKLIPKVKVSIINDAGHIPSIERSTEFNKIVLDFLRPN